MARASSRRSRSSRFADAASGHMQDKTSRPGRGSVDAGGAAGLKSLPSIDLEMASHHMTTGPGAKSQDLEGAAGDCASPKELQLAAAMTLWRPQQGE